MRNGINVSVHRWEQQLSLQGKKVSSKPNSFFPFVGLMKWNLNLTALFVFVFTVSKHNMRLLIPLALCIIMVAAGKHVAL